MKIIRPLTESEWKCNIENALLYVDTFKEYQIESKGISFLECEII